MFLNLKFWNFKGLTQIQMISDTELSELLAVPREWRNGDDKVVWPRSHDKYNVDWLEMLWKYLCEYSKDDLTMMENLNIVYGLPASKSTSASNGKRRESLTNTTQPDLKSSSSHLVLFKLCKNSNLVYTPNYYDYLNNDTNSVRKLFETNFYMIKFF